MKRHKTVDIHLTPIVAPSLILLLLTSAHLVFSSDSGRPSFESPSSSTSLSSLSSASPTSSLTSSSSLASSLPISFPIASPSPASTLTLPLPKPLLSSDVNSSCSAWRALVSCSCYLFDDGSFIECSSTDLQQIKHVLQTSSTPVNSFSIYNLNQTIAHLPDRLFYNSSSASSIQHLQMSFTSVANISSEAFLGLEQSLRSLSVVNSKLNRIPQQALNKLKNLETLDLEANDIVDVESYAFYGLPVVSLNLQGNSINELVEYAFAGLENTLEELVLISNKLKRFPLVALRRLRKLQILKLQSNQISEIPDDGYTRLTVLKNLFLQSNNIDHLNSRSFITMPKLVSVSLAGNKLTLLLNDNGVFTHLVDLEALDLSSNNLRYVELNNLRNLRTLDLSNNHLHNIELHNLPKLKELFLSHNNILKITNETFINTTDISVLYLQHNAIHILSHNALHHLPLLLTLDLSYNRLREIHSSLFKYCHKLQSLYLDNNLLVDTGLEPGTFQELVELRDLRLQRNMLKRIRRGVFYSLPNLQELDLQMNQIEEIESLESLANLEHLNLMENKLIEISDVLCKYPSSLRFLQLSHNQIFTVHNDSLSGQTMLEVLWLNYNKLPQLTENIFRDLREVQKIYLDHNQIAVIDDNAFASLNNLLYLNLDYNNLKRINARVFQGTVNLIELRIRGSNITNIEPNAFKSLQKLKILDLSDNQMHVIRKFMFSGGLPIEELKLSNVMAVEIEANAFNELDSLRWLDVSMNNLSHSQIDFLFLPTVKYLDLSGNNLTSNLLDEKLVNSLPELEYLDLSSTHLDLKKNEKLFKSFDNLKVLKLKGNSITSFTNKSLFNESLSKIRELYLDDNQLDVVLVADVLGAMSSLEILSLTSNNIKHIPKGCFSDGKHIKTLNMSLNSISVVDPQVFHGLSSLQQLDLSNNVIRSIAADVFDTLYTLNVLSLDGNWFQSIPNNFIRTELADLRTLSMNRNPMLKIREDLSVVGGFPSLDKLSIDHGNLTNIASHDFFGFSNLKLLSLRHNQIQKISPSAFRPLRRLVELDLSFNHLEIVPEERLTGLLKLRKLNLTRNNLVELPHFSVDLKQLQQLDVSYNKLSRVDTFGHLAQSVARISLRHNMIGWIANNVFQNMTALQELDLRDNFLSHLSDTMFEIIEVRLEVLLLSGNPFHCDCRLLSFFEWLEAHSRLFPSSDRTKMICVQPEKLKDNLLLNLHPIDICPVPQLLVFEIVKIDPNSVVVRWEVQNDTIIDGFVLDYYLTSQQTSVSNKNLLATKRRAVINKLQSKTFYTVCVQANGKYLKTESNKPTPFVVDHMKNFGDYITSNRKCLQVQTSPPADSEKKPLSMSLLSFIVGGIIFLVLILTSSILFAAYKYRQRRRRPMKNDVPEEYITYRHFSLPSSENVYS